LTDVEPSVVNLEKRGLPVARSVQRCCLIRFWRRRCRNGPVRRSTQRDTQIGKRLKLFADMAEVVLLFRPVCGLVKMDQGFMSGR
jgi:hypothetical protein